MTGDFIEKSLENYTIIVHHNKEVLIHMEVYKHYISTYNNIVQYNTHQVTGAVGLGVLPLPACTYSASFLLMVKQWSVVDVLKTLREQRREHLQWINKREYKMKC